MIRRLAMLAIVFALTVALVPLPSQTTQAQDDVTITWATIAGFYTDWAEQVAAQFEEETGVNIEIIDIDFPQLYQNQVLEAVGDTGAYDILTYDVGWKAEFSESGYLLVLDDYIAAADPAVIAFDDISPALTETTSMWRGNVYGLPYYTFTMGYFYRCDLFENEEEMAAFEAEYGYPLGIPRDYDQLADISEFFRREPGETLAGAEVMDDFYGIGLMAGRFPHVQDEINSIAWSNGYKVTEDDGSAGVTSEGFVSAVDLYVNELLPYAPPGALTSAFDEVRAQMNQGLIAQTAAFYLDQYPNMVKTEDEVEGARICTAPAPQVHTWVGAFGLGVSSDSANPQEAFDFLAWLAGPEAQRQFAAGGGSTARVSILTDAEFIAEHPLTAGHFPTLQAVLEHTAASNFYPNYLFVPQGGKIYNEMTTWYSAASSGDDSPEGAMANMAEAIGRQCEGPCEIANDALGEDYSPAPMEFDYDAFIASGAYDIDTWIEMQ